MTDTIRTVVIAATVVLAAFAGVAIGAPSTTTTTSDAQANETASVSFADQQIDGERVTIESATLPDGGFAVVTDQQGTPIGHSEYLQSGDHQNLTVELNRTVESPQVLVVTLYRNNGTETYNASADSVAYEADGAEVSDVGYVFFEQRSRDAETTAADTTTSENEAAVEDGTAHEDTTTAGHSESDSSGSTPGFTPITALVALVAAALVALRRR